ncbi:MAG TPA: tRNA lysidine(34) synthetase TilS, partial [Chitinophagaceae bacterium]|nr:tRNA lysidine(34) synthetase TilS [Chitinophagaceae bacterium]
HCSREDIRAYAAEHGISFREDSSNAKQEYTRNKMRLTVIPMLETIFPTVKQTLLQNQQRFDQTNQIFQQQVARTRKKIMIPRGKDFYFSVLQLIHLPALPTLLGEMLKPYGFSFEQVAQVIHLLESQSGAFVESHSHRVIRNRQHLILTTRHHLSTDFLLVQKNDHRIDTSDFHITIHQQKNTGHFQTSNSMQICVDAAALSYPLQLRKWKQGDYFYPLGLNKKKKVARLLIDEKVPLHEKENCWVLVSDQKIVWVIGLRMDHRFRVEPSTTQIVQFEITMHNQNNLQNKD